MNAQPINRLIEAAHKASELMDGCPDDDVLAAASTELSEAAAAVSADVPPVPPQVQAATKPAVDVEHIRKPIIRARPSRRDALTDPNAAARRTPKRGYRPKPKPAPLPATRVLRWAAILAGIAYAAGTIILTH